jgi:acetyl-CoA C-acetyltransferase
MTAPVSASAPRRVAVLGGSRIPCTVDSWADPEFGTNRLGNSEPLGPVDPAGPNVHGSPLAAGHPFAAAGATTGARIVATLAKLADRPGTPT